LTRTRRSSYKNSDGARLTPSDDLYDELQEAGSGDPREEDVRAELRAFFEEHTEEVFFSKQLEVRNERKYFHWLTNRALHNLIDEGFLRCETRQLKTGGRVLLLWRRGYRFYKRKAALLVKLVEEYADPNIAGALGLNGEFLLMEGMASRRFVMEGRNTRTFAGRTWTESGHDLDFIFQRDEIPYGVEVKNMLRYMEREEFEIKIRLCEYLGLRPVFAVRMIPRTWIQELHARGGFGLIMEYQLYPYTHRELAKRVANPDYSRIP